MGARDGAIIKAQVPIKRLLMIFFLPFLLLRIDLVQAATFTIKNPVSSQIRTMTGAIYIFVDPVNGSDTNLGTFSQPFQTIPTAMNEIGNIKKLNSGGLLPEDVHIVLRAGTYYLSQTLGLGSAYSGNNGNTVYIEAYPGETPIISGGQFLGTVPVSKANSQWTTSVAAGLTFKRLRVGNNTAVRARYPALNPITAANCASMSTASQAQTCNYVGVNPGNVLINGQCGQQGDNGVANTMCSSDANLTKLYNSSLNGAQLFYFPQSIGATNVLPITNFSFSTQSVITLQPTGGLVTEYVGDMFYLENFQEALYQNLQIGGPLVPNAWYLSPASLPSSPGPSNPSPSASTIETLYYNVPAITAPQDVVGSNLMTIIKLGEDVNGNPSPISNIVFDGLTFMDTDYSDAIMNAYFPPASYALEIDYSSNITIRNSTFENLGSYGIGIENNSSHNFIYNNTFNNLGGGGVGIGYNSDQTSSPIGNIISFNSFSNIGRVLRNGTGGVVILASRDNIVSNNTIQNTSFAGIFLDTADGYRSYGNSIEYNQIINTVQEGNDMGPFYVTTTSDLDTGTTLQYNFLKNSNGVCYPTQSFAIHAITTPCFTEGIYLDEDVSGVNVYGNVVENASNSPLFANSSQDVMVKNNIFYNLAKTSQSNCGNACPYNLSFQFFNWWKHLKNFSITDNIFVRPPSDKDSPVYQMDLGIVTPVTFETALPQTTTLGAIVGDTIFNCLNQNGYFLLQSNQVNPPYNYYVMKDLSAPAVQWGFPPNLQTSTGNQQALQTLLASSACGSDTNVSDFQTVLSILQQAYSVETYFAGGEVDYNLYNSIDQASSSNLTSLGHGWSPWTGAGFDGHSISNIDPGFVDAPNDNFTLNANSKALTMGPNGTGFIPLPLSSMGNTGYPFSNHPPVLTPVPDQTVTSDGGQVQFTVNATSLDNDIKTLTMINPPQGALCPPNATNTSCSFTWTPPEPGRYKISFLVQDAMGLSDIMTVVINAVWQTEYYYWPLNDGSGTVLHEYNYGLGIIAGLSTVNGFSTPVGLNNANLIFKWACTTTANCPNGASGWTIGTLPDGSLGNELLFNNNYNDVININNDNYNLIPPDNGPFSISFFFQANISNHDIALMSNESHSLANGALTGFRMAICNNASQTTLCPANTYTDGGTLQFWSTQSGGSLGIAPVTKIVSGQWYQVIVSYSGSSTIPSKIYLYSNGQLLNGPNGSTGSGIINSSPNNIWVGNGIGGLQPLNGTIYDLKIYNYALTATGVSNLAASEISNVIISNVPSGPIPALTTVSVPSAGAPNSHQLRLAISQAMMTGGLSGFAPSVPLNLYSLTVSPDGNGMVFGSPASNPNNVIIKCGVNPDANLCNSNINSGTTITLTASADNESTFTGWALTPTPSDSTCTGTTSPCSFTMSAPTAVEANFIPNKN